MERMCQRLVIVIIFYGFGGNERFTFPPGSKSRISHFQQQQRGQNHHRDSSELYDFSAFFFAQRGQRKI